MAVEDVIAKIRDGLKGGKNLPVRVVVGDAHRTIDESKRFQFTKWDDGNKILWHFELTDPQSNTMPDNRASGVTVSGSPYALINDVEVPNVAVEDLDAVFESMASVGCTMSNDFKNLIKNTYKQVLRNPYHFEMPPTTVANLLGPEAANTKDDWYNGKFTQNFKETRQRANINEYAAKVAAEAAENTDDSDSGDTP